MTSSTPLPSHTVEDVPIDRLHPDPANPRRIGDDELEALTRSLREFGFVQPVLARRDDGIVVGGHQRLVAARRLGIETVPVIWLDHRRSRQQLSDYRSSHHHPGLRGRTRDLAFGRSAEPPRPGVYPPYADAARSRP